MKTSQYLGSYLGTGYTIGTFLAYNLRGKARRFSDRYARALRNACERAVAEGKAVTGRSIRGGVAYFPAQ